MNIPEAPKRILVDDMIDDSFTIAGQPHHEYDTNVPFSEMVTIPTHAKLSILAYTSYFYETFTDYDGTPIPPKVAEPFYLSLAIIANHDPSANTPITTPSLEKIDKRFHYDQMTSNATAYLANKPRLSALIEMHLPKMSDEAFGSFNRNADYARMMAGVGLLRADIDNDARYEAQRKAYDNAMIAQMEQDF